MGHEPPIEAMRDARRDAGSGGMGSSSARPARRRDSRAQRRVRRRRALALVALIALLAVGGVVLVSLLAGDDGGGSGGDFAGTWAKTNGQTLTIKESGSASYEIVVGGGHTVTPATLSGGVLTAANALGVQGMTLTFTLKDDGRVLVETFANGSADELTRAE
jgi:hypothetical protein